MQGDCSKNLLCQGTLAETLSYSGHLSGGAGENSWEVGQMLANKGEKVLHGTCWGGAELAELKPNSACSASAVPDLCCAGAAQRVQKAAGLELYSKMGLSCGQLWVSVLGFGKCTLGSRREGDSAPVPR